MRLTTFTLTKDLPTRAILWTYLYGHVNLLQPIKISLNIELLNYLFALQKYTLEIYIDISMTVYMSDKTLVST